MDCTLYNWTDRVRGLVTILSNSAPLTPVPHGNRIKIVMATKRKTKEQTLTYTVDYPNCAEFNRFQITLSRFDKIPRLCKKLQHKLMEYYVSLCYGEVNRDRDEFG